MKHHLKLKLTSVIELHIQHADKVYYSLMTQKTCASVLKLVQDYCSKLGQKFKFEIAVYFSYNQSTYLMIKMIRYFYKAHSLLLP